MVRRVFPSKNPYPHETSPPLDPGTCHVFASCAVSLVAASAGCVSSFCRSFSGNHDPKENCPGHEDAAGHRTAGHSAVRRGGHEAAATRGLAVAQARAGVRIRGIPTVDGEFSRRSVSGTAGARAGTGAEATGRNGGSHREKSATGAGAGGAGVGEAPSARGRGGAAGAAGERTRRPDGSRPPPTRRTVCRASVARSRAP